MNRYKKLSIVFSAFAVFFFSEIAINIACGPEPDPYDYYVSYFHNNVAGDGYVPFSFTAMRFLYDEEEPESEPRINSAEWADYLGKGVLASDVYAVMYGSDRATDTVIRDYFERKDAGLPDSLKDNTYLRALANKKSACNYYLFAKEVEPYAVVAYSYDYYWDPEPRDTAGMVDLAVRAEGLAKQERKDRFLRLRYAYQAARLYHYAGAYGDCSRVYDQLVGKSRTKTALNGWALALKAGSARRLGDPAEAAYLFSKVFVSNAERRVQAYKNFHYIDVDMDEVLALAQSREEQAAIWAMAGFNNADFDLKTLETAYGLAPESPLVATLLTREVNKLETQLTEQSPYYPGSWWGSYADDSAQASARSHAAHIIAFARRLAGDAQYPEPALGTVAEAYVHWLLQEDMAARSLLDGLATDKLSEGLADQYRIIDLLLQARALQASHTIEAANLLPALRWLDDKRAAEFDEVRESNGVEGYWRRQRDLRFTRTATNFYQSLLAPHFMALGDTAMAALVMVKGDVPYSRANEDAGKSLLSRMSWKSRLFWQEQLLSQSLETLGLWAREGMDSPWSSVLGNVLDGLIADDYWDLLGTAYLRMHDYAAASRTFARLSPAFRQEVPTNWYSSEEEALYPDPFITAINDYPKRFGKASFTKADFARTMHDLQQRIQQDPVNAADYYFQMANGVYQTGTFGNSWQLISYNWTSADNYFKRKYYYSGDYHDARQAAEWYGKARQLSNDPEFKAKCTFMLAKCEQKLYGYETLHDYYEKGYSYGKQPDPFWLFSQRNTYFRELAEGYAGTEFFKQAVGECTYLADFIR